jgi:glycosyltransferase involved in cell wall biosynthesis
MAVVHTRNLAALEAVVPGVGGRHSVHTANWARRHRPTACGRYLGAPAYSPFVSRYVALSQDLERYLRERVGVAGDRVVQICNGVDSDRFHPFVGARAAIDGCPFRRSEHWLVGTVGRMDPVKDQGTLARAFVLALQMNPVARNRMRLVIVGEGALRAECERILEDGGARELAWFTGERNDIPEIMRALDCFVLPSRGEGISNTILEAMACSIPVVAQRRQCRR